MRLRRSLLLPQRRQPTSRSQASLLLGTLALAVVAAEAEARPSGPGGIVRPAPRTLKRRSLAITDANLNEVQTIHVAGGVPTTLSFRQAIRPETVILADTSDAFLPLKATETSIVLIAKRDLGPRAVATLTVTLTDGTIVPLLLATARHEADIGVDIGVSLVQKARPESTSAMKASLLQLRAELDECRADSGAAGVAKLARLVLEQEQDASGTPVFLRQEVHRRDKQHRLLVEVVRAYRLFGHTYLLLTVENRDPSAPWVLERSEVTATGNGQSTDVHVLALETDTPAISPNETAKVVVAWAIPPQGSGDGFRLQLLEKNGTRHVRLEGLSP